LKISLLIPFFNEEQQIPLTLATVIPILESTGYDFELVLVDDGSRDQTWQVISQASRDDHRIHGIRFSRNFGKEAAICAALDAATGDAVIRDGWRFAASAPAHSGHDPALGIWL